MTAKKAQPIPANIITAAQAVRDAQAALSALRLMPAPSHVTHDASGDLAALHDEEKENACNFIRNNRDDLVADLLTAILGERWLG